MNFLKSYKISIFSLAMYLAVVVTDHLQKSQSTHMRDISISLPQSLGLIFGILLINVIFIATDKFMLKRVITSDYPHATDWACAASIIFAIGLYFQGADFFFDSELSTRGFFSAWGISMGLYSVALSRLPRVSAYNPMPLSIANTDQSWLHTRRLASLSVLLGGAALLVSSFLGTFIIFSSITVLASIIAPTFYSIWYRKR